MINMKNAFVVFGLMLVVGCSTPKVVSHQTPGADLKAYTTFGVVAGQKFSKEDISTRDQMEDAIIHEMESRGYEYSLDYGLKVSYQIILSTQTDARTDYQSYPYYGRSYLYETVDVRYYKAGILLLEMRDTKTNKIVWQGSIDMKQNQNSKKRLNLAEFTALIFSTYPIPSESLEVQQH